MDTRRAPPFSVSDAVTWALAFLAREWRLVAPLTLAFLVLPVVTLQLLLPQVPQVRADGTGMGPLLAWMLPVLLVGFFGGLSITALAGRPGTTVGEAIARAARRYLVLLGAVGLVSGAVVLALSLFSLVGVVAGGSVAALSRAGQVITVGAMLFAGARLLPLLPVVASGDDNPVQALRTAAALSRGHFFRLLGLALLMAAVALFVTVVAQQTVGVVFLILARTSGQAELFTALGTLVLGAIGGAVSTVCYVVVTGVHRQLSAG